MTACRCRTKILWKCIGNLINERLPWQGRLKCYRSTCSGNAYVLTGTHVFLCASEPENEFELCGRKYLCLKRAKTNEDERRIIVANWFAAIHQTEAGRLRRIYLLTNFNKYVGAVCRAVRRPLCCWGGMPT